MTLSATVERGRRLLETSTLFGALDAESRRELMARAQPRSFPAGELIFQIGDPGNSMMAIVVGTVRISLPTGKSREIILADLPVGEVFGEMAMLDGKPRSANATALTNCELLVLQRRDIAPILERSPAVCVKLMQLLCTRVRRSDDRMADIAFFDLPSRLAKALLQYPSPQKSRGPVKLSISQREMAEMVGGTRETVNRCLRKWHREGILELKQRWTTILLPDALRKIAEPR